MRWSGYETTMPLNNAQTKTNSSSFQDFFLNNLAHAPASSADNQALVDWNALFDRHNEVACLMLRTIHLDQLATLNNAFPDKVSISFILNSLSSEFQAFMQNYNMQSMEKTISEVHLLLIEFEKSIKRNKQQIVGASSTPHVMAIQSGRVQKNKPQGKAKGKEKGKGLKNSYPTKLKKPQPYKKECPVKDGKCHHCKEKGHWKRNCPLYLAELMKKKKTRVQNVASTSSVVMVMCYLLSHKHEVFKTFMVFKNEVENQLGKTIKAIRSDRGGEYISQEFKDYLKAYGIVQQLTPPYSPQHNGVSERRNPLRNMVPIKKVDKTPYELWHGKVPNLSYLKNSEKWLVAMNEEMQSMNDNKVWKLVVLPPNAKVVKSKWIYKKKTDMDGKQDIATDRDDMKSQTGYVFVLNGGAVVWKSSKQSTTAQHATEAEYIAAKEAIWIRKFIDEQGVVSINDYPIKIIVTILAGNYQ
ncbi:retrotransposon protein, putative, ty1-copia subclass [Tanacetum coccineum]